MASDFPAYLAHGYEEATLNVDYVPGAAASEPCIPGDLWFFDTGDNEAKRCGTNPALIAGICEVNTEEAKLLTPDAKCPFRQVLGSRALLALASATTPAESHVGDQYGVTRNAGGHWLLDVAKTAGDARVLVRRVDIVNGIFFVQLLNDQLQFGAVA